MKERKTVSLDFDGVIHSYKTPWEKAHIIPDPPVRGVIEWMHRVIQHFDIQILSTRCRTWRGRRAVLAYIKEWGKNYWEDAPFTLENGDPVGCIYGLKNVIVTAVKQPAIIYIDDRAYRFEGGDLPSIDYIKKAKPWVKK